MQSSRQPVSVELIVCSHIEQKNGVFILCLPVQDRGSIHVGYIQLTSQSLRAGLSAVVMDHLAVLACAAVFELQTLQVPSLRTIFQRKDRVADTQIDERLGADNAARAACTVNDDCRKSEGRRCGKRGVGTGRTGW